MQLNNKSLKALRKKALDNIVGKEASLLYQQSFPPFQNQTTVIMSSASLCKYC